MLVKRVTSQHYKQFLLHRKLPFKQKETVKFQFDRLTNTKEEKISQKDTEDGQGQRRLTWIANDELEKNWDKLFNTHKR